MIRAIPLILIVSLLTILTACTSSTDADVISATTKPVVQAAVPSNTPKPTTSPTSTPTPTPTPTPTLLPTKTNIPTQTPNLSPTYTPTPVIEVLDFYESPDGEWLVSLERKRGLTYYDDTFTFRVTNGKEEWIAENFGYDDRTLGGYHARIPIYWSGNGEYMYYVHHSSGDGCGPEYFGYNLYRLNLQNGETTKLIERGHWFAVAPTEESIAYILEEKLVIHDLTTSEERLISVVHDPTIEYINFSYLTWSPEGDYLLVFGAEDVCATGLFTEGRYFITRLDAKSYHQTIIVFDSSLRRILNWIEPDKVKIDTADGEAWLNPETGEITFEHE